MKTKTIDDKKTTRLIESALARAGASYANQDVPVHLRVDLLVKECSRLLERNVQFLEKIDSLKMAMENIYHESGSALREEEME